MKTELIRKGNVMLIKPWVEELDPTLSFTRVKRSTDWKRKFDYNRESLYSLQKTQDGKETFAITYAGLYQAVVKKLKQLKIQTINVDKREALPTPDYSRLQGLRKRQDEVLAAIVSSHQGIVDCCTGFGKTYVICQVVRIYPTQKILITTSRLSVLKSIYKRICETVPDAKVSLCDGSHKFLDESDVVVCSAKSIKKIPAEWADILMYDEVHGAGGKGIHTDLSKFTGCRMIGFSASPEGRSDGSDKVVTALFGPIIYRAEYQEVMEDGNVVPIEVRMVHVEAPEVEFKSDIKKLRNGYWRNVERNNKIAQAAMAFPDEQVQVIVKTAEHALALRRLLPQFQLVHSGIDNDMWNKFEKQGLVQDYEKEELASVDVDTLREQFEAGTLRKVISTEVWKEGIDPVQLGALIRADGMTGNIAATQITGRLSRTHAGKTVGILVDFMDRFGDEFLKRSYTRMEKYAQKKWRIVDDWTP
jgi:superfamily II DNA or RNA helicase